MTSALRWRELRKLAGLLLLPLLCSLLGCMHTGAPSLIDNFTNSPDAKKLMNQAVDSFLEQVALEDVANKSVLIATGGPGSAPRRSGKGESLPDSEKGELAKLFEVAARMGNMWSGPSPFPNLVAGLERKLSSKGARCVDSDPDLQLVITPNSSGLQKRIFYVPLFPFFVVDLYQHRTYWYVFDATIDTKTGDGTRVVKTQRIDVKSPTMSRPRFFATSALF